MVIVCAYGGMMVVVGCTDGAVHVVCITGFMVGTVMRCVRELCSHCACVRCSRVVHIRHIVGMHGPCIVGVCQPCGLCACVWCGCEVCEQCDCSPCTVEIHGTHSHSVCDLQVCWWCGLGVHIQRGLRVYEWCCHGQQDFMVTAWQAQLPRGPESTGALLMVPRGGCTPSEWCAPISAWSWVCVHCVQQPGGGGGIVIHGMMLLVTLVIFDSLHCPQWILGMFWCFIAPWGHYGLAM